MNPPRRRVTWSLLRIAALLVVVLGVTACVLRQPVWTERPPSPATVASARLEAHVRYLSEECYPRHSLARENQAKAIGYIAAQLQGAGGRMERQKFATPSGEYENVIAHFGPETGPRYVIGAHFDACGVQPGADDNASGVAGLLELAVLLGKEKSLPAHFELVAYNLEEPPFFAGPYMGSAVHARGLKAENASVALMLSLEMIGYFKDERGSQSYPMPLLGLMYPSRANFIAIVGRWDQRRGWPLQASLRFASALCCNPRRKSMATEPHSAAITPGLAAAFLSAPHSASASCFNAAKSAICRLHGIASAVPWPRAAKTIV